MSINQVRAQDKTQYQCTDRVKIAYLLDSFPRLSETFIVQEVSELECQGVLLHVFALSEPLENKQAAALWEGQTKVTYISHVSRLVLLVFTLSRMVRTPWRFLYTSVALMVHYHPRSAISYLVYASYLAFQLERDDITHLHGHYATTPAAIAQTVHLLTGISYSFTAHARDIYLSPNDILAYKMQLARFVVTCTAYNQRYLENLVDQHVAERIHCVYHGLNLHAFPACSSVVSTSPVSPLILAVGRLVEKKGLSYLLRACHILREHGYDFTCSIVGDGPLRQVLEQEIRELSLTGRVELCGAKMHEQVIKMYQQATVAVLPCVVGKDGDRDGIPNVLVEALCMGVPVVSTPISGIPELISSEVNGLLVPPKDSTALATALGRLFDDPSLRDRLAIVGRQTVLERFDMARNTTRLLYLLCADEEDRHDK